jgi:hypothetical protein
LIPMIINNQIRFIYKSMVHYPASCPQVSVMKLEGPSQYERDSLRGWNDPPPLTPQKRTVCSVQYIS